MAAPCVIELTIIPRSDSAITTPKTRILDVVVQLIDLNMISIGLVLIRFRKPSGLTGTTITATTALNNDSIAPTIPTITMYEPSLRNQRLNVLDTRPDAPTLKSCEESGLFCPSIVISLSSRLQVALLMQSESYCIGLRLLTIGNST
jgi:hypothetical protein